MKIEIVSFSLIHKQEKKTPPASLYHWSTEGYIKMEKITNEQCIKYIEDYVRDNNMRILNGSRDGMHITYTLLRE